MPRGRRRDPFAGLPLPDLGGSRRGRRGRRSGLSDLSRALSQNNRKGGNAFERAFAVPRSKRGKRSLSDNLAGAFRNMGIGLAAIFAGINARDHTYHPIYDYPEERKSEEDE